MKSAPARPSIRKLRLRVGGESGEPLLARAGEALDWSAIRSLAAEDVAADDRSKLR
jgi:hypothetical protein